MTENKPTKQTNKQCYYLFYNKNKDERTAQNNI